MVMLYTLCKPGVSLYINHDYLFIYSIKKPIYARSFTIDYQYDSIDVKTTRRTTTDIKYCMLKAQKKQTT
jgi:hypothetical protein